MRIERPQSLSELVLVRLRERIVEGDLALGSLLSERVLAEELQVSKTPVREALTQLRSEGLVTIVPQKGALVFTLSAREVSEICEFRLALESCALELSMARDREALAGDLDEIVSAMKSAQEKGDVKTYLRLDTSFHATFFKYCCNRYLRDSYERYVGKIAALRTHLAVKPLHTKLSFEEHVAFRDAVAGDDVAGACAILRTHIGRTRETYAEEIEDIAMADTLSRAV